MHTHNTHAHTLVARSWQFAVRHPALFPFSTTWHAQVARYCQEGFRAAVDANCYDACVAGGRLQSFLTDRGLDEKCDRALKETPRPLCHDACVRGYRSGIKGMSVSLVKRMAKVGCHGMSNLNRYMAMILAVMVVIINSRRVDFEVAHNDARPASVLRFYSHGHNFNLSGARLLGEHVQ